MFKTLTIAALAACAAAPALAQSSVTIYGRLNVTAERQHWDGIDGLTDKTTEKGIFNNASRLGFMGTEDLGGGLRAGFQLEHRFNVDTGATTNPSSFWAGQSEVNLGSNTLGTIRLGRFTSEAYYATADYVSMHNHDTGSSSDFLYAYVGRDRDKVGYMSPTWGGFVFHASVAARDQQGDEDRIVDLAGRYDNGPLHLGIGYERANSDVQQVAVRALYEIGAFTVGGYYQRDKNAFGGCQVLAGSAFECGTRNNFRLAGMYAFGASELHLNVGFTGKYSNIDESKGRQYTIAYNYNLSKRTKVYAYYTALEDDDAHFYTSNIFGGPVGDFSSFAVGLRHNF